MSNLHKHFREYSSPNPDSNPMLRAKGNLNYLQFIDLLKKIWTEAHPKIPIVTSGADDPAMYPCIVYSLQLRKTHPNEPKMRYREAKNNQDDAYVIGGQRFQNIIYFQAVGEAQNVDAVEHLIEVFEDFMMEFTPVFKELGVSELVYARRLSDTEQQRPGANTVARTVSYMVTTEKVVSTRYERLKEIVITARIWLDEFQDYYGPGTIYDGPRYHLTGPNAVLYYVIEWPDIEDVLNDGTLGFQDLPFYIRNTNFRINDRLYIMPSEGQQALQGFYRVVGKKNEPYTFDSAYFLNKEEGSDPDVSELVAGRGEIHFISENVPSEIIDQQLKASVTEEPATPDS